MKHVHSELIKAWADGAEIEYLNCINEWDTMKVPCWDSCTSYRIKPTPKPDEVRYVRVCKSCAGNMLEEQGQYSNLKLTFDGETGKLKAAEVI